MNFEFINGFVETAKGTISELVKTQLADVEKKHLLDERMADWSNEMLNKLPVNFIVKIVVKKVVINNLPIITQAIFDLLKDRIIGLTKEV